MRSTIVAMMMFPLAMCAQNVTLPWTQTFEEESAFERFTVLDANTDDQAFKFNLISQAASCSRTIQADDWLFSPKVALKAGKTYSLAFVVSGESQNAKETYEVKIGQGTTVDDMTKTLIEEKEAPEDYVEKATVKTTFSVAADGEYNIGWHFNTAFQFNEGALYIYSIELKEELAAGAPTAVTNATVTPAANGGNSAVINFTAPSTDQSGGVLASLTKIDVYRGDQLVHTFENPLPGSALSYTDTNVPNGTTTYKLVPSNAQGQGSEVSVSAFVGVDTPAAVAKLNLTYANGKAQLAWDKVTTGANGAYVNPASVTYTLKRGKSTELASALTANTYEDTPTVPEQQELLYYSITPKNEAGEGKVTYSKMVVTGKPYTLPMFESFKNGKMSNFWLVDYNKRVRWTPLSDEGSFAQDADRGFIAFTPMFDGEWSRLESGLIDLGTAKEPMLTFYYKTHTQAEDTLVVSVSKDYAALDTIKAIPMQTTATRQWIKVELPLKQFVGSKFIQLAFDYKGQSNASNIYLDNISLVDRQDNDLKAELTEAPAHLRVDYPASVVVSVTNIGANAANDYDVVLYNGDKRLASMKGAAVAEGNKVANTLTFTPQRDLGDVANLYAKVEFAADQDLTDNTTDTVSVNVKYPSYPAAKQLQAVAGTNNKLTWGTPNAPRTQDEPVTESFEDYADFSSQNIGDWSLYDVDNHTVYGFNESSFPGMGDRQAWTVFNYSATTPASGPGWKGHSGNKLLISFGAPRAVTQNWLVSPELPGKAQTISLWEKAYKGDNNETYSVYYSTTGFNRADFQLIADAHVVPTDWAKAEYNLPEGAKYFAIVASSKDGFATLIDDITFLPDSSAAQQLTLVGYNIYRDGVKVNSTPVQGNQFTDTVGGGQYTYTVTAVYDKGESRFSNAAKAEVASGIETAETATAADVNAPRYDLSGRRVGKTFKGLYISNGKKLISK